MTKQLEDLFDSFSAMQPEDQLQKIREVRHRRTIERPAAAKKRQKRERKKSASNTSKLKGLVGTLSPEEKAAILKTLKGE